MMPGNFWENPNEFKAPNGWLCENIPGMIIKIQFETFASTMMDH